MPTVLGEIKMKLEVAKTHPVASLQKARQVKKEERDKGGSIDQINTGRRSQPSMSRTDAGS